MATPPLLSSTTQYKFLEKSRFQLVINRMPNVAFYAIAANIPNVSVGTSTQPTPFRDLPVTGTKPDFDNLVVTFLVDEKMINFIEVFEWIKGYSRMGNIDNIENFLSQNPLRSASLKEFDLISDMDLLILTPEGCQVARVVYKNAFPISLSGLDFTTTIDGVEYQTATVTITYSDYDILRK